MIEDDRQEDDGEEEEGIKGRHQRRLDVWAVVYLHPAKISRAVKWIMDYGFR
jgi:hypothetical protein